MPLNIRVVAATNRDLATDTKSGTFRLDLYHRLNVVTLKSPPLRERGDDIRLLAENFLQTAAARCHSQVKGFSAEAVRCIERYAWPGNVRELYNAVEHAVILGASSMVLVEDLPESVLAGVGPSELSGAYHQALGETRRDCVIRAWTEAKGDHDAAARILGVHSNSLRRMIRQLKLRDTLGVKSMGVKSMQARL